MMDNHRFLEHDLFQWVTWVRWTHQIKTWRRTRLSHLHAPSDSAACSILSNMCWLFITLSDFSVLVDTFALDDSLGGTAVVDGSTVVPDDNAVVVHDMVVEDCTADGGMVGKAAADDANWICGSTVLGCTGEVVSTAAVVDSGMVGKAVVDGANWIRGSTVLDCTGEVVSNAVVSQEDLKF